MNKQRLVDVFEEALGLTMETLVKQHHTVYPDLPPQGIYFERLARRAFEICAAPGAQIEQTTPNQPEFDLAIGGARLSLKTETGRGTRRDLIHITKLCTTERGPWEPGALIQHVLQHLSRYDRILMLRALWFENRIKYQLLEVPVGLLRQIGNARLDPVGKREGRRSLAADILGAEGMVRFRVHFDGADGKCQVSKLKVEDCRLLREWDQRLA